MKKALEELKESFQPYSLLWQEWSKYRFSGLTEEEIYIIQVHSNNDFKFIESNVIMFYNRPDKIHQIVQKLNVKYGEFQNWVIFKFLMTIMNMAKNQGLHSFLEKPIILLNLSRELKSILSNFGFITLIEMIDTFNDNDYSGNNDFKNPLIFKTVLDFLALYAQSEKCVLNNEG